MFQINLLSQQSSTKSIASAPSKAFWPIFHPSPNYTSVSVDDRPPKSLAKGLADSPLELFQLFISAQHCRTIAYHTNIKAHDYIKKEKENNHRAWNDVIGPEIEVFLGILLFMGLYHAPSESDYWNTCPDKPVFVSIQEAMSLNRFENIKRFLKINNGRTEPSDMGKGPDWWKKLEPLATDFQTASLKYYQPGSIVSVDEQLIKFKGRSRHTLQIASKHARKGLKIYSLCQNNYLISFLFASRVTKISQLKTARQLGFLIKHGLSDSALVVIQLCQTLPEPLNYVLFCDNFFTSTKPFKALRSIGIAACGTAKKGSGSPERCGHNSETLGPSYQYDCR